MRTRTSGIPSPTTTLGWGTSRPSRFVTETLRDRRRYLPPDYRADASPIRIDQTVYVRPNGILPTRSARSATLKSLRHVFGLPTVAVAHARLDDPMLWRVLVQQASFEFVRSVRHKPRANGSPAESSPGGMTDSRWRNGLRGARPQQPAFRFADAMVASRRGDTACERFPDIPIIVNHTGLPADRSAEGVAGWKAAMRTLAPCPNVAVKISGLGQQGQPWTVAANRDIVLTTIDLFGSVALHVRE